MGQGKLTSKDCIYATGKLDHGKLISKYCTNETRKTSKNDKSYSRDRKNDNQNEEIVSDRKVSEGETG